MSYALQIIGSGVLGAVADTALYTATSGTTGTLYLRNSDGSARTVTLGIQESGGTIRYLWALSLAAAGHEKIDGIALANGDKLIGYASAGAVVFWGYMGADGGTATTATNLPWTEVTGTSASMAVNNRYCANNAALVTLTLPSTAAIGDVIRVRGKGAGGWKIAQNASQYIRLDEATVTTTGVGGYITAVDDHECVDLVCVTADN